MKEYKLFNTDGKTFFDFRSNPESRCEGFTLTYCDDGTVVMSGDYGTLCWKRDYNGRKDYGFPNKDTNIGYFNEKVCQWGIKQVTEEFDKHTFIENVKDSYGDEDNFEEFLDDLRYIEDNNEWEIINCATKYFQDAWECGSKKYTDYFVFIFNILQSVSEQVLEAVNKENNHE